jgi:hypothetical protein
MITTAPVEYRDFEKGLSVPLSRDCTRLSQIIRMPEFDAMDLLVGISQLLPKKGVLGR